MKTTAASPIRHRRSSLHPDFKRIKIAPRDGRLIQLGFSAVKEKAKMEKAKMEKAKMEKAKMVTRMTAGNTRTRTEDFARHGAIFSV